MSANGQPVESGVAEREQKCGAVSGPRAVMQITRAVCGDDQPSRLIVFANVSLLGSRMAAAAAQRMRATNRPTSTSGRLKTAQARAP